MSAFSYNLRHGVTSMDFSIVGAFIGKLYVCTTLHERIPEENVIRAVSLSLTQPFLQGGETNVSHGPHVWFAIVTNN